MIRPHKKSGFTLIEILVVVSIIGVLSSITMASLNSARTKARNAARFAQVKQLMTALDMYKLHNGKYPTSVDSSTANFSWYTAWVGQCLGACGGLSPSYTVNSPFFTNAMSQYLSAVNLPVDSKSIHHMPVSIPQYNAYFNTGIMYSYWKDNTAGIYDGSKYVAEIVWINEGGNEYCPAPASQEADRVAFYISLSQPTFPIKSTICEIDMVDG